MYVSNGVLCYTVNGDEYIGSAQLQRFGHLRQRFFIVVKTQVIHACLGTWLWEDGIKIYSKGTG